jgi:phenylalanyl-tRNA synthetase beta chain
MRAPWSWIKEFVPVESSPEEIADRLSMRAIKVERVERLGGDITGVVVGSVVKMEEHPDADKLMLVTVDTGADVREIVCGARNYSPGDRVPVALPGAMLPGDFHITERTVRGKVSHGMMCSARELHLSDDHSGILILPSDTPLGTDVRAVLGLDDAVLDLDVTSNRPDALSIVGIAREIAVMEGLPLAIPASSVAEAGPPASELAGVEVKDAKGCPRYLARVITGLRNGESPQWMQRRLLAAGMRPISAIVDVTNYVLLERGQPLHAFDLSRLEGRRIVVRKPRKGERITTLDGVERTLDPADVAICDASRPVAVAGIMGGGDSEVSPATTDVLLESAYFDPARIRATARRLGLRTEASVRFERGADIEAVAPAADRACELLAEICGGSVARGAIDVAAKRRPAKPVRLRVARANELIGVTVQADEMASMLRSLGMEVTAAGRTALRVVPPAFRPDIAIEEDLIEEVARLHGYENVPETLPSGGRTGGLTREQRLRALARRLLLGAGLSEAQTLSLLPPSLPDRLGLPAGHPWRAVLTLDNPLSEEESVLRPAILPGLLLAAERNIARRVPTVALFEIGTVFAPSPSSPDGLPHEEPRAAWILTGASPDGWHGERAFDVFDSKGVLDALVSGLGARDVSVSQAAEPSLHPGRAGRIVAGAAEIGWIGELHPRIARALDLPARTAVGEVALTPLFALASHPAAPDLPRYPAVDRDVAVVVPAVTLSIDVRDVIATAGGDLLESVSLFDVYRGAQIGEDNVSLAFRLAFRHPERTLTDAEAAASMDSIASALRERGWTTRE